jgi:hypothetical protein
LEIDPDRKAATVQALIHADRGAVKLRDARHQ